MRTGVEGEELVFRLVDPGHAHEQVSVWSDVEVGGPMDPVTGGWELAVPTPDLDCLEYLFDVDGALSPDPGNPEQVDGAFGPHSWLAFPGYEPPGWLAAVPTPGEREPIGDHQVWSPTGGGELPLLLVHDGAEMDEYGEVVRYAATHRPMRVALLAPGPDRDQTYSANPEYGARLVEEWLPDLLAAFPTIGRPVLLGQSLGALAALHAGWAAPAAFAGLVLQSGSFFTPELDPQESGFGYFDRVTGFVDSVLDAREVTPGVQGVPPVAMTCGTAEENLANNRLMRDHLRAVGAAVTWGEVRQGHTWTCWRDTLDPHLTSLLRSVWD